MQVNGRVVSFNENTLWGEVCYDLTVLPFHGTTFRGGDWPKPGTMVTIFFSDSWNILLVEPRIEDKSQKLLPKPKYNFCWWCGRKLVYGRYRKRKLPEGDVIVHVSCNDDMRRQKVGNEISF